MQVHLVVCCVSMDFVVLGVSVDSRTMGFSVDWVVKGVKWSV